MKGVGNEAQNKSPASAPTLTGQAVPVYHDIRRAKLIITLTLPFSQGGSDSF